MSTDVTTPPRPAGDSDGISAEHSTERPRPKTRDPYFSNAKLLLILSVVCGHTWAGLISDSHTVRALYLTLYDFHMPAFILLCGYFSKSFVARPDQIRRVLTGVLAPYLIFCVLYGLHRMTWGDEFSANVLTPYYLLWFLAALFVWRLTSPIWRVVRHPVLIATAISVAAIFISLPGVLELGRVLQFLPFFVAGMFLERRHFELLKRPLPRAGLTVGALLIVAGAFFFGGELDRQWIYFNEGAEQMDLSPLSALPTKLVVMATAVVLVAAFLSWVPDRRFRLSGLGDQTMYAFLLHGFVVKAARENTALFDTAFVHTPLGEMTLTVGAVLVGLVLMAAPVRWLTRPFVEPRLDWLLRRSEQRPVITGHPTTN